MKRLFALNAATHVENGKKNLIARKSPQQVFLVNATSKLSIDIEPITASLSSAEAPARYPYKNSNNGKIERAWGTMGEGKGGEAYLLSFPFPSCPARFLFFLPCLPTTQGGLCGGESSCFYKRKQWGSKDDAVVRKSPFTRVVWPRIPVPGRVCCWFNTIAFSALATNK